MHYSPKISPIALGAASLAAGIALGEATDVGSPLLLAAVGGCVAFLSLCHWKRWRMMFAVSFALAMLSLGMLRAGQGDFELLPDGLREWGEAVNARALERLHALDLRPETERLLDAMLLSVRTHLPSSLRLLYREVGASHVLALSGLHLSILFGTVGYLQMRLTGIRAVRVGIAVVTCVLLGLYCCVTGFPVSLVRASCMMSLLFVSHMRLAGRSGLHALAMAAMVMLFVSPSNLTDIGFQLSFCAVAGIMLFFRPIEHLWFWPPAWIALVWQACVASLAAQLGSMPLVVFYFHRFSLYSVLLSPLNILLATLILYGGLLLLVAGRWVVPFVELCVSAQHALMHVSASLPYGSVVEVRPSALSVALLYAALLCLRPLLQIAEFHLPIRHERYAERFLQHWPYIVAAAAAMLAGWWFL